MVSKAPARQQGWDPRLLDDKGLHFEPVALEDLNIDPNYQRPLRHTKVARMMEEYNPDELTAIVVSRRDDGSLWVLDGQHRVEVLNRLGKAVVLADIRSGLTREQEAFLFYRLNEGQTAVSSWDKFRARLAANEPIAVKINETVEAAGFHIANSADDRAIAAVSALERLFNIGKLRVALQIVGTVWPYDKGALSAATLLGLGSFLMAYEGTDSYDDGQLLTALDGVPVAAVSRRAKEIQLETGRTGQKGASYAYAIRDAYNGYFHRGRKPNRQLKPRPIQGVEGSMRAMRKG